jgi:hypothetical protein
MTAVMKATVAAEAVIKVFTDSRVAELHRLELQTQAVPVIPDSVCVLQPSGSGFPARRQPRAVTVPDSPVNEVR